MNTFFARCLPSEQRTFAHRRAARRRIALGVSIVTLSFALGCGAAFAQSGGGNGGYGSPPSLGAGGAGATGYTGATGGNGSTTVFGASSYGGGGGGGAAGGGLGGIGATAGSLSGGNGGTGGANGATGASVTSAATGANGTAGATAAGGGGGGGGGGYGYIVTGSGAIANTFAISGGTGGAGGVAGQQYGAGGSGGMGMIFTQTGVSFTNSGTISGGNGGNNGGDTNVFGSVAGNGGDGLSASAIAILNSGTISAGAAGIGGKAGASAGYALRLTGGNNTLTTNGGTLNGGILISVGSLTLQQTTAGGATGSASYSNVISGAGALIVTTDANKSVTLSGANTYTSGTQINGGTLVISADSALGATSGAVAFSGGTLQTNASLTSARAMSVAAGQNSTLNTNGNTVAWSGAITASGGFVVAGGGTLTLSGAADNVGLGVTVNSATTAVLAKASTSGVHAIGGGGLNVEGGTARLGGSGGDQIYDEAAVAVNSGTFDLNGQSETIGALSGTSGTVTNNSSTIASTLWVSGSSSATFSGTIGTTGNGIALVQQGTGSLTLGGSTDNGYLSATVNSGTLVLAKSSSSGIHAVGNGLDVGGGVVQLAGTGGDQIYDSAAVTVNSGIFDLNGRSETIASLFGSNGLITNTASTTLSALTVGGSGSGAGAFGGTIKDGAGRMSVVKAGSGTLTLSGNNPYTGATLLNAGKLLVTGSISGSTTTVSGTGTTLGGTGTVGSVNVGSGAILEGGNGDSASGMLSSGGDISLSSGSAIRLTLGPGATHSSLGRTGGTWKFDINQHFLLNIVSGAAATTYQDLITGLSGGETGLSNISHWTIDTPGVVGVFSYDGAGNVDLTVSAVPEPEAAMMLLAGLPLLTVRRRRRTTTAV